MALLEDLKALGANVTEGLDRVMGDSSLYEMMLGMFVTAVNDNPVSAADFDGGDVDGLIKRVHTLKGITGNLAITPLFLSYTEVLGFLRSGDVAQAKSQFEKLLPVQEKVLDCIKRYTQAN